MIRLSLPYPPSANRLWRSVRGVNIKSAEYRKWEQRAHAAIAWQGREVVRGPYEIVIEADRPDNRRRDLGNLEKACSDALVSARVIQDDCEAQEITLRWSDRPPGKGALVHVTIHRRAAA